MTPITLFLDVLCSLVSYACICVFMHVLYLQSLNLFVESFLKMVQKLLECNDTDLQRLASASFVKFANIEEDTPSYHQHYDCNY